ncbi:DUF4129 domain-containing protein [Bacillus sp. FSL K6-3431]|uniref:DUF4129 domain-containing protein n=1 Tax=Bacillus sp. FSL K6-3431 TaxID=2921500 RepID=UPI0030FAB7CD
MSRQRDLLITFFQGVVEYLLLFPFILIIGILVVASSLWAWLLSLLVLFVIGILFKTLIPNQKWWISAGFSLAIGVFSSLIFYEQLLFWILLAIIHPVFIYRGMMYASHSWGNLISTGFMWFGGFIIYFISYFLFRYVEKLHPYMTPFTVCGAIVIVLILFISNSDHLKSATLSKQSKPMISRAIKSQNRLFLTITIALIAVVTNGQMIRDALMNGIKAFIRWILGFGTGTEGEQVTEQAPPPASMDLGLEPGEPSAFAKFLEVIVTYIFYVFLIFAAIAILLLIVKKTRMWIKRAFRALILFLQQIGNRVMEREESGQYIDEKESVFDWQEWKKEQQDKAKGFVQNIFKREPRWESLSNQQKVRFVYRNFLLQQLKTITYKSTKTPRETLQELKPNVAMDEDKIEKLRDAYEQTRYGEKDIGDDKIKEIYSLMKEK